MSNSYLKNPSNSQKFELNNSSGNNNPNQIPSKIINQKQIINTTKSKKIIISKKYNDFQNSPQRIIYTNKIYNSRMESPIYTKVIRNSKNKIFSNEENNHSFTNINQTKNNIIYTKDDFNNNKFYQKKFQNEYSQEEKLNNYKKIISYDLLKNKNLLKYNSNYEISPKKDSKILLKSVICSPVSVHYTEIKDAELKLKKEYKEKSEKIEESEIIIKNKIINIWENANQVINDSSFSLICEKGLDKNSIIESYEKKIEELNQLLSNSQKNEFLDYIIQSFSFKLKRKSIKNQMKFKNIQQKINEFYIPKISNPKENLFLNIEEIKINPDEFKQKEHSPKSSNELEKINDIIIPGQKKERFSSDQIYGQELSILSNKKKKNILKIEKKVSNIEIYSLPKKLRLKYEKNNDFCIQNLIHQENIMEVRDKLIKQELIINKESELTILTEKNKNDTLFVGYVEKFNLEGKIIPINQIEKNKEIEILKGKKSVNCELKIEKVEDIYLYTDINELNKNLDIEIGEDIFYDEIQKPENEIIKLDEFSFIRENYFKNVLIEKAEEIELISERKSFTDFVIEKNDFFIIEKDNSFYKELEYESDNMKKYNNFFIPEKLSIIDAANFQIISIGIRELYQQKLQGFSIIKREKEANGMDISEENYQKNSENISNNYSYYNNYNIQKNRIFKRNKNYYDYDYNYYNDNNRKVNTYKSQNYKTFIAFPKGKLECIDNLNISNGNIKINIDNLSKEKNSFLSQNKNDKNEINENKSNNFIKDKHDNLNNSFSNKYNKFSYNKENQEYIMTTPTKKEDNQNKNDFKTFTEQRIYKKRIYKLEEVKANDKIN